MIYQSDHFIDSITSLFRVIEYAKNEKEEKEEIPYAEIVNDNLLLENNSEKKDDNS